MSVPLKFGVNAGGKENNLTWPPADILMIRSAPIALLTSFPFMENIPATV